MILIKSVAAIFTVVLFSCCSGNKAAADATNSTNEKEVTITTQKMMDAGFAKAAIVASDVEGDCPFTMSVDGDTVLPDPINLEEGYMKQGKKIWVKFTRLKMMNRCDKANPVRIEEIQKREE